MSFRAVIAVTVGALAVLPSCARRTESGGEIAPVADDAGTDAKVSAVKSAGRAPPPWPSNVPNSHGPCSTHAECAVLIDAPQLDPCCTHRVLLPVTRAYADWSVRFRAENCAGVTCPPEPLPGPEPACCVSIGRCVNHKCVLGCEDPTLDAPKVPWLDSQCRMPVP